MIEGSHSGTLKRGPTEMRFFAKPDEAATWCLETLGVGVVERPRRTASLLDAVERMREAAGFPPDDPRGSPRFTDLLY